MKLLILLLLISICSCRNDSNTDYETAKYKRIDVDSTHTMFVRQDSPFDEADDQNPQMDLRNKKDSNIIIGAGEYYLPVFVQTKHRKQRIDTFKKGDFILYERYDKQGEVDSIWTNKTPLFNNWDMSKAVMTFTSPFDDDTTKIESGNGEFTTPSVSFTLPNAARKVFDKPQSKTDTVRGWIRYWSVWAANYMENDSNGVYRSRRIEQLLENKARAVAIYEWVEEDSVLGVVLYADRMPPYTPPKPFKKLIKILVNGKPFPISDKKYEFIRDDEIIK